MTITKTATKMLYIGIDPGVHTGYAVWDSEDRKFIAIKTVKLYEAILSVWQLHKEGKRLKVVFEDARQRTWIPREKDNSQYRGRLIGSGSIKRDSKIWEEFCEGCTIPYMMIKPSAGMTKWSEEYFRNLTDWQGRTSYHARDAAALVFGR